MSYAGAFRAARRQAYGGPPSAGPVAVPVETQRVSNWCWLATTAAVGRFQGETLEQCELADTLLGESGCCAAPYSSACNRQGIVADALQAIGRHAGTESLFGNAPSLAEVQSQLDAGRPPIGQFEFVSGAQHAVVLAGYGVNGAGQETVRLGDPALGWNPTDVVWEHARHYRGGVHWAYACWTC